MDQQTMNLAAALIAVFEGERLTAYKDPGGIWTIGFGHTFGVHEGMTITHDQAVAFMWGDLTDVLRMMPTWGTGVAGAALLSFGYNCGSGTLHRVVSGLDTIDNPIHTTDRHGVVQPGLISRRRLESLLLATKITK